MMKLEEELCLRVSKLSSERRKAIFCTICYWRFKFMQELGK